MKVLMVFSLLLAGIMADSVSETIQKIKDGTYQYAVFKLDDNQKLETEVIGNKGETYDNFVSRFPSGACRYGVNAVNYENGQKIVFIFWNPDSAKIKQKVMYASNSQQLRTALNGYQSATVEATDYEELKKIPNRIEK